MLLSLGYGCGLRAGEVVKLKVKHIDSAQKIIRVEQSKSRKGPQCHAVARHALPAAPMVEDAPAGFRFHNSRGGALAVSRPKAR